MLNPWSSWPWAHWFTLCVTWRTAGHFSVHLYNRINCQTCSSNQMLLFQNLWFHVYLIPQLTLPIRYLRKMLDIFASHPFYTTHTHLSITNAPVSSVIHNNPKCWPYFHNAIGAIDGSHIPSSASHHLYYCNGKDFVSQNCLFVCNFDLKFTYRMRGISNRFMTLGWSL
jgi:hypothetical protein